MSFTPEQVKLLSAPLHPQYVKPPAPGRFGDYIEGWHAIAEANRIFGFDGWCRQLKNMTLVNTEKVMMGPKNNQYEGWTISYLATVTVVVLDPEGDTIIREGTGAGHGKDRDLGLAHESAAKEAETDAMKRAMMTLGNQFGLALYDKEQRNVSAIDSDAVTSFLQELNALTRMEDLEALLALPETIEMAEVLRKSDPAEYRTVNVSIKSVRTSLAKLEGPVPGDPKGDA